MANYGSQAKCGPLPAFVNKVLLEHGHAHLFTYFLWLFHAMTTELGPSGSQSLSYLLSGPSQKKPMDPYSRATLSLPES